MKTLIIVDVQNDFLPGGSLPVPGSEGIVTVINNIQDKFDLIIATQDWHPENHMSFASNHEGMKTFDEIILDDQKQVLWPDHCVQGSKGAEFHPDLKMNRVEVIFRKGMDPEIDSYSAFYDNGHKKCTGLAGYLREKRACEIYFCGLAADICVQYSIRDAVAEGFSAFLVSDAAWPLNRVGFMTIEEDLKKMSVKVVTSREIHFAVAPSV
jgi:nicotinamidase/pyrazinamidase